jgi:hypothetical protein
MKNRFRGTWVLLTLLVLMVVFVGCEEVSVDVPEGAIRLIVHNMTDQQFDDHYYEFFVYNEENTQIHYEHITPDIIEDSATSPYLFEDSTFEEYPNGFLGGVLFEIGTYEVKLEIWELPDTMEEGASSTLIKTVTQENVRVLDGQTVDVAIDFAEAIADIDK